MHRRQSDMIGAMLAASAIMEGLPIGHEVTIWGAAIHWSDGRGRKQCVRVLGSSARDARKGVLRKAIRNGWTYPRWWQWWRWGDSRPSLNFSTEE